MTRNNFFKLQFRPRGYVSNVTIVIYLFVPLRYLQFLKIIRSTAAAAENEPFKVR